MKLASVILDIPTQALDAPYTYMVCNHESVQAGEPGSQGVCNPLGALSDAAEFQVEIGSAVLVPLGARRAVGFVVDLWETDGPDSPSWPSGVSVEKIKPIIRAVSRPYFDARGAACAQWLSREYIAPLSSCVRLFTPPGGVPRMVRSSQGYWRLEEPQVGEIDDRWVRKGPAFDQFQPRKNAYKQIEVLKALENGELRVAELNAQFGAVSSVLRTLQSRQVISVEHRRRLRGIEVSLTDVDSLASCDVDDFMPSEKPQLTEGQHAALKLIIDAYQCKSGEVVVVDGVTGSGKTEVYLQAIETVLKHGQNACVLVPEISLTPQTVARFRGRFGNTVAVMHSRMSAGERYDQWDYIRSGRARVVVGARSALFTPLKNVGIIVIDEEHEGSYKQDQAPRYQSRDVAAWQAKQNGSVLVLGSATPSIESLYMCEHDPAWHRVSLPNRANGKPLPPVQVVNMASEFNQGSRSMFSYDLQRALRKELALGHKAVLLLNQRGFAKFLLCRDCGFVPKCPHCDTTLTFHEYGNTLVCHHCGYKMRSMQRCPQCNSPYLKKFGAGTQRVEAELRMLLDSFDEFEDEIPIVRMDADTTSKKGAHQRLLEQFASADAAVLLGTQMIAKGLDFEDVTLVGVINADTQLQLPDFRSHERTFDLIEQVAGRAGRANLPGLVMIQTYEAHAIPIRAAATYNREAFLKEELPKRRLLGYPPYRRFANVLVWGSDAEEVKKLAIELQNDLCKLVDTEQTTDWEVSSALPCVLGKLRNTYRYHVLIKAPQKADFSRILLPYFRSRKPHKFVNVAVDVDPQDLF